MATVTAEDIIGRVDEIEPNYYSEEQKLDWLWELETILWHEVYLTHEGAEDMTEPEEVTMESELQVPRPYARDIYENYLKAKISQANGESGRYNEYSVLFNGAYQTFANYWNRTHRPLGARTLKL